MTKKSLRWLIGGVILAVIVAYAGLLIYVRVIVPRQKAYFLPTGTTMTYQGTAVSLQCKKDADCELISPEQNYQTCFPKIYCTPSGPTTRAVNAAAWASLAHQKSFVDPQTCRQQNDAHYPGLADTACSGGVVAEARCSFGKCIAIQVLP